MTIEKWNNFEIGKYKAEDFEAIAELFRDVYVKTYPHFDAKFLKAERFRKILREYTLPNSQIWTTKTSGEIIGFVALGQNFVDQLYIRKSFQNKGLGGFWIEQAKTIYPTFSGTLHSCFKRKSYCILRKTRLQNHRTRNCARRKNARCQNALGIFCHPTIIKKF